MNQKKFKYDFNHSNSFHIIEVDVDECKTVDKFIEKIAKKHSINSQLNCINKPEKSLLKDIKNYYVFNFETNMDDIKFKLIKTYNEKKEIYFSQFCIDNNLKIVYKDDEPRLDFNDDIVEIKLGPKMKFYLVNNEKVINACKLIGEIINSTEVRLKDNNLKFLKSDDELKSNSKYTIYAYYQVKFLEIERRDVFMIKMETRSTVLDAKKELAKRYNTERNVSLDNIILLDSMNNAEDNKLLRKIHKLKYIFEFKINYSKAPVERTKRNYFDDSFNAKIEEGKPFEIRKKSNRRQKPIEYEDKKNEMKVIKPQNRSDSVQKHSKPQPTQEFDSEVSESESKPRKKVNKKKFKPSVRNVPNEPIRKTLKKFVPKNNKKRVESVQKETHPIIEKEETSLQINLEFDELEGYKKRRKIKKFEKIMKIKDVTKEIKTTHKLDYVKLKYKNGKYIDQNKTLKEIEEDIKEALKGKIKYFIYVETKDRNKEKSDNDDDYDDDYTYKHHPISTKKKNKIKEKSDDDDDEDTDKHHTATAKKKNKKKEKSDDDDDDDDDIEKRHATTTTKTKKKAKVKSDDSDDDDDDDDDDLPSPKIKNKGKGNQKKGDGTDKYDILATSPKLKKKAKKIDKSDDDDDDEVRSPSKNKKVKEELKSNSKSQKITYKYQINGDDEIFEIELDKDATVLKMKQEIAKLNNIKKLSFVRIVFAGKELLEELELLPLKIGDIPLFVNIQFQEEVLLLTAKALRDSM